MKTTKMTTAEALREMGLRDGVEYHLDRGANGLRLWWLDADNQTREQPVTDFRVLAYGKLGVEIDDCTTSPATGATNTQRGRK